MDRNTIMMAALCRRGKNGLNFKEKMWDVLFFVGAMRYTIFFFNEF